MPTLQPPAPWRLDSRGRPAYDALELAAYRKANGVTRAELAASLYVSQSLIATRESGRIQLIDGRRAPTIIRAIELRAARRRVLIDEGVTDLARIRAAMPGDAMRQPPVVAALGEAAQRARDTARKRRQRAAQAHRR